ncbi:MAG: hypothetical protein AAB646_01695 [Patescibacteria group bacterium]
MNKRIILWILLFAVGGCGGAQMGSERTNSLLVAANGIVITPPVGIAMGGYFEPDRKASEIHDNLYARGLLMEFPNGKRLAFVSVDLIGLLSYDVNLIAKKLKYDCELFIFSTHQHSGPDTIGIFGSGGRDEKYMENLRARIAELLVILSDELKPAKMYHGVVYGRGFSRNWRVPEEVDSAIDVLSFHNNAGFIATLVNFGCHPEALGRQNKAITADFPGYLVNEIESRLGGRALFANGALGAMVSINADNFKNKDKGFELAKEVGSAIAEQAVKCVLTNSRPVSTENFSVQRKRIAIKLENDSFRSAILSGTAPFSEENFDGDNVITEVGAVTIGNLKIVMIPGEITPGLGKQIKFSANFNSPLWHAMLIGLANDEIGYILPIQDFDLPLYNYDRSVSVGRQADPMIRQTLEKMLGR